MTQPRLHGKSAIVTGATMGVGREIVRRFVDEGARVLAVARDQARGAALESEFSGDEVRFLAGDVGDPATAAAAVSAALTWQGRLDVLVNNAAIDHDEPLLEVEPSTSLEVFRVNFHGALWMLQAGARAMRDGGAVVNVSSRLASVGVPGMSVYGASKGALSTLTRGAAIDLAPQGVRVNAVAPGFTETPLLAAWLAEQADPQATRAAVTDAIPLRRVATPGDVAAAVAFLASDEAAHITGASLPVDGGYTAQ